MELSSQILSDIIVHTKYAKYIPDLKRRESWEELVQRNAEMHMGKFPELKEEIQEIYNNFVLTKKVLPSMRSMQFAGKPIEINPSRIFNCAFTPIDDWRAFSEIMFLLLGGTGVGYSVQRHHVEQLPEIRKPQPDRRYGTRRFLVGDSIEGWADSVKVLIRSFFDGGPDVIFDFSDIRPKGARLITSGGKAPGPEPLKICLRQIKSILNEKEDGDQLTPLEVHDIVCHIADAVLAGGIRRAALLALFSADDQEMVSAKFGKWYEKNPQRARANNSGALLRHRVEKDFFSDLWDKIHYSNSGEPGIYFTNDQEWGCNPCCEIGLRKNQFCNLCEINADDVENQEDLEARVKAAAFIGTLQASYTDFHYLRPVWRRQTEKDALLGIGMTGIASGRVQKLDVKKSVSVAIEENKRVANLIGIREAARITCVKPSGTSSLVLGCASGIHAWHNEYYIRRLRVGKNEAIYRHLAKHHPELLEDDYFRPHDSAVISVPIKAPEGALTRRESALDLLERVKWFSENWIKPGHIKGNNTHNVSATISVKENEWGEVGEWMWENRDFYNGLSVLPHDSGTYKQAPFEDITEEQYEEMVRHLHTIDLSTIVEEEDNTDQKGEVACGAGGCSVEFV
jgi:ribonucleoside-triphosphate reductase